MKEIAMNKQQKELVIELLRENFSQAKGSFLVVYKGLSVEQMKTLRRALRSKGGQLKVAKARLMKRAIHDLQGSEQLSPYLKDQIGVVFVSQEIPTIAKVLYDFSKKNEALKLIAGKLDSQVIDASACVRIASLPSREVLLAQACGVMKAPMVNFIGLLNLVRMRLLFVLKQAAEKKKE
jgi:large subunit ribosomal protein L10